jgi:two-component system sensor histidine kinase DevS
MCIEVVDDGRGMPADVTGSGLANLRQRAADSSGTFTIEALPGRGTKMRWSAPLP